MTLTGPLTSALTGPLTTSLTGVSSVQRLFATFDGTDDFISIPETTGTGDFELEFDLSVTDDSAGQTIIGDGGNLAWLRINANGSVQSQGAGVSSVSSAGVVPFDGKLHTHRITRVGTTMAWYLDGGLIVTFAAVFSGDIAYDRFGQKASGNYVSGVIANVNFTSGWAGTATNPSYPLDDAGNTAVNSANPGTGDGTYENFEVDFSDRELMTLQDNGDWLGAELVVQPIEFSSDWNPRGSIVSASGDTYTTVGAGGQGVSYPVTQGERYKFEYDVSTIDTNWSIRDWGDGGSNEGDIVVAVSADQEGDGEYTALSHGMYFRREVAFPVDFTVNSFSVKRLLEAP